VVSQHKGLLEVEVVVVDFEHQPAPHMNQTYLVMRYELTEPKLNYHAVPHMIQPYQNHYRVMRYEATNHKLNYY
jgi:hypothetical protein